MLFLLLQLLVPVAVLLHSMLQDTPQVAVHGRLCKDTDRQYLLPHLHFSVDGLVYTFMIRGLFMHPPTRSAST